MHKTAIKNFAIWARVQLIEAAKQKAYEYEIAENGENKSGIDTIGGRLLSNEEKEQRKQLIEQIRQKGYAQVMEEAAYTWFNRFIALRFMEVNGYLPSKIRVFTDEAGAFKPEILKEAMSVGLDGLDRDKVLDLLDKQNNEELYKYLLITQCNALNSGLPNMFEKIANWTELLFPANLLRNDSVLGQMISEIPEEDWTDQVQIIGWLYQYYNSELKDETFALLKKNVKITKDRIPAATQLFTPDWIVRYMVENSLGRLWYEGHNEFDKSAWKYYLDEAEQEPEVEQQLKKIRDGYATIRPEDIKVIDPCMGSGHILVYAFDVLMQIYTSAGWSERDAAKSIIQNNLYGLDIDNRAYQLAYFAVMMKARQYNRRILTENIKCNLCSITETNNLNYDYLELFGEQKGIAKQLADDFVDAKEYGSILNVKTSVEEIRLLADKLEAIKNTEYENFFDTIRKAGLITEFEPVILQALNLAQKYDVVVTNPPYMAVSNAGAKVQDYVKKNYPDSKSDLFAVFIERCGQFIKQNGYQAMITQHAWMFLSSFEKLRSKLQTVDIVNMAHLGARAFEEIGGEVVQTTSFVMHRTHAKGYKGTYCRLIEPTTQQGKEDMFLSGENRYTAQQDNFSKIPGSPVAYWVSDKFVKMFDSTLTIADVSDLTGSQHITANNEKYIRFHWEIIKSMKWIQYAKGGEFRRWYGNILYVVDWSNEAVIYYRNNKTSNLLDEKYIEQEGIAYTDISSLGTGFRWFAGGAFDKSGPELCYVNDIYYILALLNCKIFNRYSSLVNPTIHLQVRDIKRFPVIIANELQVDKLSMQNVYISQTDWNSYETSWDFKKNPLV